MKSNNCFFLVFALLLLSIPLVAQQSDLEEVMNARNEYYFSVDVSQSTDIQALNAIVSVDQIVDENTVICYANNQQFARLKDLGYRPTLLTPPSLTQDFAMFDGLDRSTYEWDSYPTYSAYESMMYAFATDNPTKCTILELGTLASGRKILVARLNNGQPNGKPKFFYSSTMHGDECTGYVLMLRLINYLLTDTTDPLVQTVMNNLDIFICPNANPDGTYYGGNNTVTGARRYNIDGVDLNRNYPDFEDGAHPDGNAYAPETQLFMQFAQNYTFTMGANYHGGAEVLNYPWDTWATLHADDAWWQYVCREYTNLAHAVNSSYMTYLNNGITNGYAWYTTSGSRQDYMNYYAECREVTIECSNTKTPTASTLPNYWNYNKTAMLTFMSQALNGVSGVVTDAVTNSPIVGATVTVESHDANNTFVKTHSVGDYHRPIKAGTYTFTFSAPGYQSQSISITAVDAQSVVCNVALQPDYSITPDFTASSTSVAPGGSVSFTDASVGNSINSWSWSFEGGTPATSTVQNPTGITYAGVGTYDVTLTVTNAHGTTETLTKSDYITVSDTPETILMHNGTVTTCNALFYDSGGASGNYSNSENYTMTFYPGTDNGLIRMAFTSFATEKNYDYLYIYDGTSTSATLIGKYTNTTSPGTVTASNADGALTIKFTSDNYTVKAGWAATVSCYVQTYSITCASVTGGTISADKTTASAGETVTLTATPNAGYEFGAWNVTNASGGAVTVTNNQFTMPASNVTVSATFNLLPVSYSITCAAVTGGIITADKTTASAGETVTLTISLNSGYLFGAWNVTTTAGNAVTVANNQFTMPASDVTVSATLVESNEPEVVLMHSGSINTCNATFYDSGGPDGNYGNSENYTLTFYPGSANSAIMAVFSSFLVESGYEQLYIYDGTSTSATLIGKYSNANSPGTVLATNADGALTFRFTSDVSVNKAGWEAAVSCVSPSYFTITCASVTGGTVQSDLSSAMQGTVITLTAMPDESHHFGSWNVTDAGGNAIAVTDNTFVMPASDVTVSAIFEEGAATVTHYQLVTSLDDLSADDVCIIASEYNGKAFAVGLEGYTVNFWGDVYYRNAVFVTATNGAIPLTDGVVEFNFLRTSSGYYNIYDASTNGYLYVYRSYNGVYSLRTASSSYYKDFIITIGTNGAATVRNRSFSRDIGLYEKIKFAPYAASSQKKVYIYKKVAGNSDNMDGMAMVDETEINVDLYPNPTDGNVTVEAEGMNHITVANALGQIVYDEDVETSSTVLNLGGFNAGIYLVRVVTESGVTVKRVTLTR